MTEEPMAPSSEELYEKKELVLLIMNLIDMVLDDDQKDMLLRKYMLDQTLSNIASSQQIPVETLRGRLKKALGRIRYLCQEMKL